MTQKRTVKTSCLALLCGLFVAWPWWAQASGSLEAVDPGTRTEDAPPFSIDVRTLEIGGKTVVSLVDREGTAQPLIADVKRTQVFAQDAMIVVHHADGDRLLPPPNNIYLKGRVRGRPESHVVISVLESGEIRGIASDAGRFWMLGRGPVSKSSSAPIEYREVETVPELDHKAQGYECMTDSLSPAPAGPTVDLTRGKAVGAAAKAVTHTARIAVETDNEFYNKFGNATAATNYVADVIAYSSTIYSDEVNTSWLLQHLSLWAPAQTDPWSQQSPSCGLYEFGRYWNDNRSGVARTTAAFFSGKSSNSGIAWVGVLCRGGFNVNLGTSCAGLTPSVDNYGGAYAYIGGMDANFNIDNPSVVWDILAVTHEIGHNFNSGHTHCYEGLGGNGNPVDPCYSGQCGSSGCFCGTSSLPSGCPGAGYGCGTIMSYCHLRSGGMSNITLTLGEGHPYGIAPGRVPDRMSAHVASQASSYPGCLDYTVADLVFSDDFESGDTGDW